MPHYVIPRKERLVVPLSPHERELTRGVALRMGRSEADAARAILLEVAPVLHVEDELKSIQPSPQVTQP